MAQARPRRGFGGIRKLPSGRLQAYYTGPDLARHVGPLTFEARVDAESWLSAERALITAGTWTSPAERRRPKAGPATFGAYAADWLARRDLKPRTRVLYADLLERFLVPAFGDQPLRDITPAAVATWHHRLGSQTGPTYRSHAYGLLRTIMRTAVDEDEVSASPCRVRGAGNVRRARQIEPATVEQLTGLVAAMPDRLAAAVLLSSWCGLRFGEVTELRRADVDTTRGVLHVRRAVAWVDGKPVVGTPKSDAGVRDVSVPPHLLPALRRHLLEHTQPGARGLLFPAAGGGHLSQSSLNVHWWKARRAVGREDLRWHDLRHTGAVLAAQSGATLAELMARIGHSTPSAALRYQHAAQGRDAVIAARLSELAGGAP